MFTVSFVGLGYISNDVLPLLMLLMPVVGFGFVVAQNVTHAEVSVPPQNART